MEEVLALDALGYGEPHRATGPWGDLTAYDGPDGISIAVLDGTGGIRVRKTAPTGANVPLTFAEALAVWAACGSPSKQGTVSWRTSPSGGCDVLGSSDPPDSRIVSVDWRSGEVSAVAGPNLDRPADIRIEDLSAVAGRLLEAGFRSDSLGDIDHAG